jgi:hypothetical protein
MEEEKPVSYTSDQVESWKQEMDESGDPETDLYFYEDSNDGTVGSDSAD